MQFSQLSVPVRRNSICHSTINPPICACVGGQRSVGHTGVSLGAWEALPLYSKFAHVAASYMLSLCAAGVPTEAIHMVALSCGAVALCATACIVYV